MKTAYTPHHKPILASVSAPTQAICPHCKGIVDLRQRRQMNSGAVTYFWRHRRNQDRGCPARSRPFH